MKNISILGSTGSIGVQTLEVINILEDFKVVGLSTNKNIDLLIKQIIEFKPQKVAIMEEEAYELFCKKINDIELDYKLEVFCGINGLAQVATVKEAQMIVNALVGNIGLYPTLEAIKAGKDIALANKETLVTSGQLVNNLANLHKVTIYPIDSEHSAIYQCLQGKKNNIQTIYLTASGGPFRNKSEEFIKNASIKDALNHPNWCMGQKITIDSATMMNKGLEVIEAKWLFDIEVDKIKVLVHPQSIIHSMVEFEDGAIMAQLGEPDMRTPILYALNYPNRVKNDFPRVDFTKRNNFTFEQPDFKKFKCLQLAYDAINVGGTMPTVLNGANEVLVNKFLEGKIKFIDIPKVIEKAMYAYTVKHELSLNTILEADKWARDYVEANI
jgi:1-deoxy-D-xylulose-5-phosphate reductoisomerase